MKGTTGIKMRRDNAFKMLEAQLTRGTKPEKINGKTSSKMIPLTDGDKKRISAEMTTLSQPRKKR